MQVGAQVGENPAGVGILQGKTELYPEETEADVPYLPEGKLGLFREKWSSLSFKNSNFPVSGE